MKERLIWVDWLKGLCIFLVILGHIILRFSNNSVNIHSFIGMINSLLLSFHMPLFAMLSGFFFSSNMSFRIFVKKKTKQLLLPYIFWCIIQYLICPICLTFFYREFVIYDTLRDFYKGLTDWGFWYIRALFLCFLYANLSIKIFRFNKTISVLISVLLLLLLSFIGIIPNSCHFFQGFVFLYPFFCCGYILKKNLWDLFEKRSLCCAIFSFIIWIILIMNWQGLQDTFYGMNTSVFAPSDAYYKAEGLMVIYKTIYRIIIGCAGSFTLIFFAYYISIKCVDTSKCKLSLFIANVGRCTLGIYILQTFFVESLTFHGVFSNLSILNSIFCIVLSVFICVILYIIVNFANKVTIVSMLLSGK